MSNFVNTASRLANTKLSENGGRAWKSTGEGPLLDFFSSLGSYRTQRANLLEDYRAARKEDSELADNCILYARNIRNGGMGERAVGRALINELAILDPEKVKRNFDTIVSVGRWDDLFVLFNTSLESDVIDFIAKQFKADVIAMGQNKPISLLAKWMPSINTSSEFTKAKARKICKHLGLSERTYRKSLAALRKYSNVLERTMSDGNWEEINFESVPSIAMSRYINTFNKRLPREFEDYKSKLVKGEAKVNASVISPVDICQKWLNGGGMSMTWNGTYHGKAGILDTVDREQWKALPNYVDDSYDVVVMADISGSMTTNNNLPMAASIGLATYFAERNQGAYHGLFMTFSSTPAFVKISDNQDLEKKFSDVITSTVGYSTNMDKAFELLYYAAKESGEVPKAVVVISDGEMDYWVQSAASDSVISKWNKKIQALGLEPIKVVSWNVNNRTGTKIAPACDMVSYCGGYSAGTFKELSKLIEMNAYEAAVEILMQPQFSWK